MLEVLDKIEDKYFAEEATVAPGGWVLLVLVLLLHQLLGLVIGPGERVTWTRSPLP